MRRAQSKEVKAFIAGGPEPKVDPREMAYRDLEGPEESAVLRLARAMHAATSDGCATSWLAQEQAATFHNAHGLRATLDECVRLEALRRPTATN